MQVSADGGQSPEIPVEIGHGQSFHVLAKPYEDPARVVEGPLLDPAEAKRAAVLAEDPDAVPVPSTWLVSAVVYGGYRVQWADVEKPETIAFLEGCPE